MKKIRTLLVKFSNELAAWEVSAFRGAVIEKVGRENILFNHHLGGDKFLFKYPLIQYKSINRNPAVFCLGDGVDEIHKFFNKTSWEINIKDRKVDLVIDQLNLGNATLNIWDKTFNYRINNWLALNTENFKVYNNMASELEQLEMLEKILIGNILSMAKGMAWDVDKEIKVRITKINKTKNLKYKNTHLLAFNIDFTSNASLPQYIGLGKGVSRGYGVVSQIKNFKKIEI